MPYPRDQNGEPVYADVRRESNGTWSANVWFGGLNDFVTTVRRQSGYATRAAARDADIGESVADTNTRHGYP